MKTITQSFMHAIIAESVVYVLACEPSSVEIFCLTEEDSRAKTFHRNIF